MRVKKIPVAALMMLALLCAGCEALPNEQPSGTTSVNPTATSTPASSADAAIYKPKAANYISLRKAPDLDAKVISRIDTGQRLVCLDFEGIFMRVRVEKTGETGYVNTGYIERVNEDETLAHLSVVDTDDTVYSYDRLQADLKALQTKYPGFLQLQSLGKTADGRDITLCIIGSPNAANKVFVSAAIHGREYMTSLLCIKQIEQQLYAMGQGEKIGDVAFYAIPMLNPDGVTICQFGANGLKKASLRTSVSKILKRENIGASAWKANARGVDLNRNFDADWNYLYAGGPSVARYRGEAPFCEAETKAVQKLVEDNDFKTTISYHASGSVIFWRFKQSDAVLQRSKVLGQSISDASGYPMSTTEDEEDLEGGGLKDWALMKQDIPSLTIEIGSQDAPLPQNEWDSIWQRNREVFRLLSAFANGDS